MTTLLEASIDPVVIVDRYGLIEFANTPARSELGFASGNIDKTIWQALPELIDGMFRSAFEDVVSTGITAEGADLDIKNRRWFNYQIQQMNSDEMERSLISISWKGANQERILEASLSELELKLDFLYSVGQIVHYTASLANDRIYFSKNGLRSFGRSSMSRAEFLDRVHPEDVSRVADLRRLAMERGGDPVQIDFRYVHPSGTLSAFRLRAVYVPGLASRAHRVCGVAILLSDRIADPPLQGSERTLTGLQIRGARGMLGWSVKELARRSGVSISTIARVEEEPGPSNARQANLEALQRAFEMAGAKLFAAADGSLTISLASPDSSDQASTGAAAGNERNLAALHRSDSAGLGRTDPLARADAGRRYVKT